MRALLCLFLIACTSTSDADKDATTGSDETDDSDSDSGTGDTDSDSGTDDPDTDSATEDPGTDPLDPIPYEGADPGFKSLLTADGSEFTCEYVEESCPSDCDGNVAPVLSNPVMVVNGVISPSVAIGDHLVIRVDYTDADCNIACGGVSHSLSGPDFGMDEGASLCSNQPCDGETGFVIGVVEAGDYSWSVRFEDACGAQSAKVSGAFTL